MHFTAASLSLSLFRMASGSSVKIWVKLEGRRATKVSVSSGADIDDVIQEALRTEMLNIPPGCVSFHFDGKEVETDVEAVYYQEKATRQNPLILEIDHEGILLVLCDVVYISVAVISHTPHFSFLQSTCLLCLPLLSLCMPQA